MHTELLHLVVLQPHLLSFNAQIILYGGLSLICGVKKEAGI